MSLRAIRRLQQQQEIEEAQKLEEEQEELSEEEHDRPQKAQNLFDLASALLFSISKRSWNVNRRVECS